MESKEVFLGKICMLNEKGFGFIRCNEGRFFFHCTGVLECGFDEIAIGDMAEFELIESDKGKKAVNVILVENN